MHENRNTLYKFDKHHLMIMYLIKEKARGKYVKIKFNLRTFFLSQKNVQNHYPELND